MTKLRSKAPRLTSPKSDPVTAYAQRVVAGKIIAGPHVRDACARHLRDLIEGPLRGLKWDIESAKRATGFFTDVLRLNGGRFEGSPFNLELWQAFIVGSLFGWKGSDGTRRFRVAFVETGKGSGKSPLAAGVGLYCMVADGEHRAEVYAAATKRDQAQILFRDAVAMVDQSPELDSVIGRSGSRGKEFNLAYLETDSFFRPISSDDGQSGPRPHCVLLDEIHEHRTGNVVEMLRAGTKGRTQALIFMITNSGANKQTVCWEYHEYAARVCSGAVVDDSFFGYVCALDDTDDPFNDPKCWVKANPSLGITIPKKYLEEQITQARGMPSKESVVKRLNFCMWVEAETPWISFAIWNGAQQKFETDSLYGRRCYAGLDLSSTQDLTALVLLFEPIESDPVWRLLPHFWLPAEGLYEKADQDRVPYIAWRDAGWLHTTPGRAISKLHVLRTLSEVAAQYDLQKIAYDRWRIEDLKMLISDEGISLPPLVGFGQGYKDMAPAVDEFERRLLNDHVKHNGNPVMTWCAANAVVTADPANNRKIDKSKATGRVDGIVAAVMAVGITIVETEKILTEIFIEL